MVFLVISTGHEARAYFDPGTGSLLIQALVAMFGGCVLFFKEIKLRIKNFISKIKK